MPKPQSCRYMKSHEWVYIDNGVAWVGVSDHAQHEITDVVSLLAKEKKVKVKKLEDYWIDLGNPGDVIKLSQFIKHGNHKTIV